MLSDALQEGPSPAINGLSASSGCGRSTGRASMKAAGSPIRAPRPLLPFACRRQLGSNATFSGRSARYQPAPHPGSTCAASSRIWRTWKEGVEVDNEYILCARDPDCSEILPGRDRLVIRLVGHGLGRSDHRCDNSKCYRPMFVQRMRTPPRRTSFDPTRRISETHDWSDEQRKDLANHAKYVGSGHHKRYPANYGLERTNPRRTATVCDGERVFKLEEALSLLASGIRKGMVSTILEAEGMPKYIWSVSEEGQPFEAKTSANTPWHYHGYPLDENDAMRERVLKAWKER